jgi:hypothetical protein
MGCQIWASCERNIRGRSLLENCRAIQTRRSQKVKATGAESADATCKVQQNETGGRKSKEMLSECHKEQRGARVASFGKKAAEEKDVLVASFTDHRDGARRGKDQ